jgi:hypothetical protein
VKSFFCRRKRVWAAAWFERRTKEQEQAEFW